MSPLTTLFVFFLWVQFLFTSCLCLILFCKQKFWISLLRMSNKGKRMRKSKLRGNNFSPIQTQFEASFDCCEATVAFYREWDIIENVQIQFVYTHFFLSISFSLNNPLWGYLSPILMIVGDNLLLIKEQRRDWRQICDIIIARINPIRVITIGGQADVL